MALIKYFMDQFTMFHMRCVLLSLLALAGELCYGGDISHSPAGMEEVPPPSKVKVICNNFHTMVYWDYEQQSPHPTSFTVTISGSSVSGGHWFKTYERQYNVTWLVWGSARRPMDLYSVKIAAMQDGHHSTTVETSFTFNDHYTTADVKCLLDLPPLSVTVKDLKATVNVVSPLHVYEELQLLNSPLVQIIVRRLTVPRKYIMKEEKNKELYTSEFCFPEDQKKYCVELEGRVFDHKDEYRVLFRNTGPVCTQEAKGNSKVHTAILVGGAVIGGVGALLAAPLGLAALGFTSAGITAGSIAAIMMAKGGAVTAGSLVAFLQAAAAAGFSAAVKALVAIFGAIVGTVVGTLVDWWYSSPLDCRALSKP